jgi:hypothetical protein
MKSASKKDPISAYAQRALEGLRVEVELSQPVSGCFADRVVLETALYKPGPSFGQRA